MQLKKQNKNSSNVRIQNLNIYATFSSYLMNEKTSAEGFEFSSTCSEECDILHFYKVQTTNKTIKKIKIRPINLKEIVLLVKSYKTKNMHMNNLHV